ncbi:MAG TPA: VOC family protein [Actinomycetota bacterium]|nr:VOC family protein [Actinomycetota bacterium]
MTERPHEIRFVAVVDDVDEALRVFRDALGLDVRARFEGGGGSGVLVDVPAATLELFEQSYSDHVDRIEAGRPLHVPLRIAVGVGSLERTAAEVERTGAIVEASPVRTPWGDRNQRFRVSGVQLTLFEAPR